MVFYNNSNKNVFLYFYVSCCLGLVWFGFLFDRSAYRIVCLLACLIDQLLYLALFDCFFVCSPDWLFSLFLLFVYFSSLGLSLFQRVTVALPRTSCCLYTCISMRVFLLPLPPPLSLSLSLPSVCLIVGLSACLSACLSVRLSVCLSVCQSVSVSHPHLPPLPLSVPLFVPLFLYSIPPSPCVLCPLLFFCFFLWFCCCYCCCFCFCFYLVFFFFFFLGGGGGGCVVVLFCFLSCFVHWILNTSRARFKRM